MNILAIETSSGACSAAVLRHEAGATSVAQRYVEMRQGHAEALMGMISAVMEESSIGYQDLDRIAVSVGPGSFTGTRVGIAAARGIALAAGKPLVAASSLAIIAEMVRRQGAGRPVAVALAAGRGDVYLEVYDTEGRSIEPAQVLALEEAARLIAPINPIVAGSAAADVARSAGPEHGGLETSGILWPDARVLALMAVSLEPPTEPPIPLYLKPADAKPLTQGGIGRGA
jgi:tRNA threonylcarbamoyladenosine biosynthesis protein TsaB